MYRVFLGSLARKLASHLFFPCETLQAITKAGSSSESRNSAIECMSTNLRCLILQGEQVPGSIVRVGQKAVCSVIEAARASTNSLFTNKKESSLGLPESRVCGKFGGEVAANPGGQFDLKGAVLFYSWPDHPPTSLTNTATRARTRPTLPRENAAHPLPIPWAGASELTRRLVAKAVQRCSVAL
jgi:hypothetical protein